MKTINIILLALIIIGIGLIVTQKKWVPGVVNYIISKETTASPYKDGFRWFGPVTGVRTDCFFDGECSVSVANIKVVVNMGDVMPTAENREVGSLINVDSISDFQKHIGDRAEVYARKIDNGDFTLYGNVQYYIKLSK